MYLVGYLAEKSAAFTARKQGRKGGRKGKEGNYLFNI